ncbi:pantothenate kinase [Pseudomonas deceptionensis]|uniref:Type III pantothenate kinase n=1 Tax=Pseudomonas deceptionensis TaxID=882211 RepID=A0A0J6GIB4_PSEDM|nr:pantothenate kinase [Pseudomonas deceptionensis]KMM82078.1 pantothenate kinase [Pseudomonas deceptionensis]SEE57767.1 type III pantothenate kinase [Pseudomonas deceptionensis]
MILEMDCGNSFIKWRALDAGVAVSGGVVDSDAGLIAAILAVPALCITHCRLVSVRSDDETSSLVASIVTTFGVDVQCAQPAKAAAGVSNGYEEYARLGLDRWLAVVGAFELSRSACLVLDFGTAVTADFVAADGQHLGGFICPGMPLMRDQLRTHTRRIRYDDLSAEQALLQRTPGRTTVEAVERGCLLMMRGFVLTQLELAREYWGQDFEVFLTGGDAGQVKDMLPDARLVQDLVFVGLAVLCPLP